MSTARAHVALAARLLHSLSPATAPLQKLRSPTVTWPQTRLFTRETMIKNYGVLPLVGIMAAVPVAVGVFCLYQMATRDVTYSRNKKPTVEQMDLMNPKCYKKHAKILQRRSDLHTLDEQDTALVNTNPDHYKPNKELADLLQELSDAEEAAKNCECPE